MLLFLKFIDFFFKIEFFQNFRIDAPPQNDMKMKRSPLLGFNASKERVNMTKSSFSVMGIRSFNEWIAQNQIDHLLMIGLETPICLYQTAVHALGEEIGVTLLSDCIGERRPEDRGPALQQLLNMGAHILPSETIFYSLLGSAEHPKFREFTELVKKYA